MAVTIDEQLSAALDSVINGNKLTGVAGFLAGPQGALLSQAAGPLLSAFGSLFLGGGKRKRLNEAQRVFRNLLNSSVNEAQLARGSQLFQRASLPALNRLFSQAASRVGLDSGIGQGVALNQFADLLAQFNTQQFLNERNRVAQDRRLGAQGLASIIDV